MFCRRFKLIVLNELISYSVDQCMSHTADWKCDLRAYWGIASIGAKRYVNTSIAGNRYVRRTAIVFGGRAEENAEENYLLYSNDRQVESHVSGRCGDLNS